MRNVGIGHVYDIMESVADAGERLETVMRVESAAGGLAPESAERLRSAYDAMMSAVGDLAKAATRRPGDRFKTCTAETKNVPHLESV